MMNDVGMPAKGHALFADKLMVKHAIRAIADDLRHV